MKVQHGCRVSKQGALFHTGLRLQIFWCVGVFLVCFCGGLLCCFSGVFVVVFWWCFCDGVWWWCFCWGFWFFGFWCGGAFLGVFLWWCFVLFCGGFGAGVVAVFFGVFLWWCFMFFSVVVLVVVVVVVVVLWGRSASPHAFAAESRVSMQTWRRKDVCGCLADKGRRASLLSNAQNQVKMCADDLPLRKTKSILLENAFGASSGLEVGLKHAAPPVLLLLLLLLLLWLRGVQRARPKKKKSWRGVGGEGAALPPQCAGRKAKSTKGRSSNKNQQK